MVIYYLRIFFLYTKFQYKYIYINADYKYIEYLLCYRSETGKRDEKERRRWLACHIKDTPPS